MSIVVSLPRMRSTNLNVVTAQPRAIKFAFNAGSESDAVQSRSRKSEQDDKWSFCLTTAIIAVNRRNHEQTTPPEPLTGLQGEGGSGRRQGRPHNRPVGGAFRRSPQSDHSLEIAA